MVRMISLSSVENNSEFYDTELDGHYIEAPSEKPRPKIPKSRPLVSPKVVQVAPLPVPKKISFGKSL